MGGGCAAGIAGATARRAVGTSVGVDGIASVRPGLAVALVGLEPAGVGRDARSLLEWAHGRGFRAVQWNAAAAGARPRDLDRSARRDLAATLRRLELGLAGVDLLIPAAHYVEDGTADRALSAARAGVEFAAELAGLVGSAGAEVLTVTLPGAGAGAGVGEGEAARRGREVLGALVEAAERCGGRVADASWPAPAEAMEEESPVGVAIDPAAVLAAGAQVDVEAARIGRRVFAARLSDTDAGGRTAAGEGRLDVRAYVATLATIGFAGSVALDLRGVARQREAARKAMERFEAALI